MYYNERIAKADRSFNKSEDKGPFDIIGDVHGCFDELIALLQKLGYAFSQDSLDIITGPPGRKIVFVGDLVDRGPKVTEVLKLVISIVEKGLAYCVPGNHDEKLMRYLMGRKVQVKHGLEDTVQQLSKVDGLFRRKIKDFFENIPTYLLLDQGNLIVAHSGIKENMIGYTSKEVREFCLYGESTGVYDENGLPERVDWAANYKGNAFIVYGHTAVLEPYWQNRTIDIDTGCVFGGKLTAFRYPEMETISVPAFREYVPRGKPFGFSA